MLLRCKKAAVAVLAGVLFVSCGGSQNSPTGPSNPTTPSCRIYPTAYTMLQTGSANPSFAGNTTGTCSFSTSTLQFSCTIRYSDTNGFSLTNSSVATYASLADVLAEVAVIPPLKRVMTVTGTVSGQPTTGTQTYTYDSQNRLTRETGTGTTTTYSAWDNPGRPTAAVSVTSNSTTTLTMSYNDSARTMTTSNTQSVATTMGTTLVTTSCVQAYDANGNQVSYVCTSTAPGAGTTNGTTNITSTGQVCR